MCRACLTNQQLSLQSLSKSRLSRTLSRPQHVQACLHGEVHLTWLPARGSCSAETVHVPSLLGMGMVSSEIWHAAEDLMMRTSWYHESEAWSTAGKRSCTRTCSAGVVQPFCLSSQGTALQRNPWGACAGRAGTWFQAAHQQLPKISAGGSMLQQPPINQAPQRGRIYAASAKLQACTVPTLVLLLLGHWLMQLSKIAQAIQWL